MDKFKSDNYESIKCIREFIIERLNFVDEDRTESESFLKLKDYSLMGDGNIVRGEGICLDSPEKFGIYFEGIDIENPDKMLRPKGDTTYFTSAGVQRIETILRDEGKLERKKFIVAQPSIRSQFMDKVKDGVSTSFVNFSVESVFSTPDEFIDLSDRLIKMVVSQGAKPDDLKFQINDIDDRWGDRKFTKTVLTLYLKGIEVGECVYIHDYPSEETEKVAISDICFGVERLNWALGNNKNYFPEFKDFYKENVDSNKITSIIDCMRTAVLMAGEGVKPSHHDPGYRLRQLSKRFVLRNQGVNINATELMQIAFAYWGSWGHRVSVPEAKAIEIINSENERNFNVIILSILEKNGGPKINTNVNQPTNGFLKQVNLRFPKKIASAINDIAEKIK